MPASAGLRYDHIGEIWVAQAKVAGALLELPTLHPSEQEETVRHIHNLQSRLLARPGLRALGWDR